MSQALKLWLTPHQIVEQTGSRLAANLAKIDFTGCRRIGQLFGHHRRHDLRASHLQLEIVLIGPEPGYRTVRDRLADDRGSRDTRLLDRVRHWLDRKSTRTNFSY